MLQGERTTKKRGLLSDRRTQRVIENVDHKQTKHAGQERHSNKSEDFLPMVERFIDDDGAIFS